MSAERLLSRFSFPIATLLLTLWLVFLAVHSAGAHRTNHTGAVTGVMFPQPVPLPLVHQAQVQPRPTAVVHIPRPVLKVRADVAGGGITLVNKDGRGSILRNSLAVLGTLLVILTMAGLIWYHMPFRRWSRTVGSGAVALLLVAQLTACGTPVSSQPAQSSTAYLHGALNWIEAHSVFRDRVNWKDVQNVATRMMHGAHSTAAAYPGIIYAMEQTRDDNGFLLTPSELAHAVDPGMKATYADRMVVAVQPNGPAARAGVHVGDIIESINGSPPRRFEGAPGVRMPNVARLTLVLKRAGKAAPITISFTGIPQSSGSQCTSGPYGHVIRGGHSVAGYINLSVSCQSTYTSEGQDLLRAQDHRGSCGWIIDVRQTTGGDIWNYLAAMGPIIGDGRLGGFLYPGGKREPWTYRHGKVLWNGHVRDESQVQGSVFTPKYAMPPIAVLTSHVTNAAGELFAVALRGRPNTRIIGEPTQGFPNLQLVTPLSDGAVISVSGAFSFDRTGHTFKGPVMPDIQAKTQWSRFGREGDSPVQSALRWLQSTHHCSGT